VRDKVLTVCILYNIYCVSELIQDVSIRHDTGQGAIEGVLDRHVESKVDWDKIKSLEIVGIDVVR